MLIQSSPHAATWQAKSLVRIIQYALVTKKLVQGRQQEEEMPYPLLRLLSHCSKWVVQVVPWSLCCSLKRKRKRVNYIGQVVGCVNVNNWHWRTKLVLWSHPFLHADYWVSWSRISRIEDDCWWYVVYLPNHQHLQPFQTTIQSTSSLCCYCSSATCCTSMTMYAIRLLYVFNNIHSRLEFTLLVVLRYSWFIIPCCTVIG